MSGDGQGFLYRFHKELHRPFATPEELLSRALALIARRSRAERVSVFLHDAERQRLMLRYCLHKDLWFELEEQLKTGEPSPFTSLLKGEVKALSFDSPHPILYAPLRFDSVEGPAELGLLRLERPSSRKLFSPPDRAAVLELALELAQNLHQTRLSLSRQRQLKRLETLTELTAIFASSLRVESGLKLILQGVARHFQFDRVRLYLVNPQAGTLRGELSVDLRGTVVNLKSEEIPLSSDEHRFIRVLRGEAPDAHMRPYEDRVLYLPLTVQAQKIGLLIVDNLLSQQAIAREDASLLGSFAGQIALAVDNARLFEQVQALSLHDSLTGLPLRRYFDQRFQEELYRVERSGEPLSVAMLDVDYFKGVNDTYGHQIGDLVLKAVGRLILKNLRKIDFPARFGGDEIVLLLPQARSEDAVNIMSRLTAELKDLRIPVPFSKAKEVGVTVSVGVSTHPEDGRTAEALIQRADEALYWVKSHGRDGLMAFRQLPAPRA